MNSDFANYVQEWLKIATVLRSHSRPAMTLRKRWHSRVIYWRNRIERALEVTRANSIKIVLPKRPPMKWKGIKSYMQRGGQSLCNLGHYKNRFCIRSLDTGDWAKDLQWSRIGWWKIKVSHWFLLRSKWIFGYYGRPCKYIRCTYCEKVSRIKSWEISGTQVASIVYSIAFAEVCWSLRCFMLQNRNGPIPKQDHSASFIVMIVSHVHIFCNFHLHFVWSQYFLLRMCPVCPVYGWIHAHHTFTNLFLFRI